MLPGRGCNIDIDIFVNCNWVDTRFYSGTVYIYTQTMLRTTQLTTHRKMQLATNWEECGTFPVFAN